MEKLKEELRKRTRLPVPRHVRNPTGSSQTAKKPSLSIHRICSSFLRSPPEPISLGEHLPPILSPAAIYTGLQKLTIPASPSSSGPAQGNSFFFYSPGANRKKKPRSEEETARNLVGPRNQLKNLSLVSRSIHVQSDVNKVAKRGRIEFLHSMLYGRVQDLRVISTVGDATSDVDAKLTARFRKESSKKVPQDGGAAVLTSKPAAVLIIKSKPRENKKPQQCVRQHLKSIRQKSKPETLLEATGCNLTFGRRETEAAGIAGGNPLFNSLCIQ